jgi:hypothetical protein
VIFFFGGMNADLELGSTPNARLAEGLQKEIVQVCTQFPDESFMRKAESLGFNRNNEIVRLMPLLQYVSKTSI